MPCFPKKDLSILEPLAMKMIELATGEEYERRRQRWRDVNEHRKPDRSPVWCGMAGVSRELFPSSSLECSDPLCRSVENSFRRHLYKDWVGDDEIFEPWYGVNAVFDCSNEYTFGLETGISLDSTDMGGFSYDHPIKTEEDYNKIKVPSFVYNHEKTQEALSRMNDLLGKFMQVRLVCLPPLTPAHSVYLEKLRSMADMLNDLAFRPELVHRAMAKITEGILNAQRVAEQTGLLTPNNYGPMTCSDPVNMNDGKDDVYLHNLWCAVNSQEFQVVSPQMQEEFLLDYQIPCLQQYGAVQYGCCEDLTHKIDIVKRIPNLRIFVCSYWTDLDKLLDACGMDYTIMWRQLSAHVMLPDDLEPVRNELEDGMKRLQGYYYQIILREVESLHGHPNRLKEWTEEAINIACKYA